MKEKIEKLRRKALGTWEGLLDGVYNRRLVVAVLCTLGLAAGIFLVLPVSGTSGSDREEPEGQEIAAAGGMIIETNLPTEVVRQETATPNTEIPAVTPTPRVEVIKYTIQQGDSIFGIAEKFGLKPESIFWGNLYILGDDVHNIQPGVEINILPADGVLHRWTAWEGLNGVSRYYGVEPMDIINWPGNNFDLATIGDFSQPNIEEGREFFVPGGRREPVSWIPVGLTRENAAIASSLGPGHCGAIYGGIIGNGTYVWPAPSRRISGYDFTPETGHSGIDIAGITGDALYAVDGGVVVYAGWHNHGYGNLVIIDHGTGFQSVYAHLDDIYTQCGQSVEQAQVIGSLGNTGNSSGPHLHFELRYNSTAVNPWSYLQP
jgi:murein DD-endopeptidase MepM/ murein hydrolase activator NlpD